jgi:hypothetical protein
MSTKEATNMKTLRRGLLLMVCGAALSGEAFADPPSISSFSPSSGPIGTAVTINGSNFDPTPANNIVYFGAVKATVVSASSTSLGVTVPVGTTYQPISVTIAGLTACSKTPFIVTYPGEHVINSKSFLPKIDFATGNNPYYGIANCDIDGDGKPDIVVSNRADNSISVLRNISNDGAVSFAPKQDFSVGTGPLDLNFGDLDGDGKLDLVIVNTIANSFSILRNTSTVGGVSFEDPINFGTQQGPHSIGLTDFDGDGLIDVAVTNQQYSIRVSIFRNTSTGSSITFAARVDYSLLANGTGIAFGDLDGDGKPEIVAGTESGNKVSVFLNNCSVGTISFADGQNFTTGSTARGVAIGDADGDGKSDLFVSNQSGNSVSVLKNNSSVGSLAFNTHIDFTVGTEPFDIALGDVDGDGKVDIATSNLIANTVSVLHNSSTSGTVSFEPKVDFSTGESPYGIVLGDIDGDGKPDIETANFNDNTISVLWNFSQFTEQTLISLTGVSYSSVAWGDYDNDGDLDVLLAGNTGSGYVSKIYRNNGDNTFAEQTSISLTGVNTSSVAWGDYDNDGDLDILLTGDSGSGYVSKIYRNNGDNTFTEQTSISLAVVSHTSVAWGDYDND